ncbi:hypothetical protein JCM3774_003926 [Rhodotorula dairenensis]
MTAPSRVRGLEPLVLPFLAPRVLAASSSAAPAVLAARTASPAPRPRTRRAASTQAQAQAKLDEHARDWPAHAPSWSETRWRDANPPQPEASTSAVRLDAIELRHGPSSPAIPPSPPRPRSQIPSPSPPPPLYPGSDDTANSQTIDALVAELAPALDRLRSAYLASPAASPLQLVRSSLAALEPSSAAAAAPADSRGTHNKDQKVPPVPPPVIKLDPQPGTGPHGRLWTPFLLHALFLGASALGLLARRKVSHSFVGGEDGVASSSKRGVATRAAQKARQEAEDRIDQVQALNLLVVALGQPFVSPPGSFPKDAAASAKEPVPEERWAGDLEAAKNLAGLLHRVERERIPYDHFTVLAALRVAAGGGDGTSEWRRSIGLWAWRAAEAPSPATEPSSTSAATLLASNTSAGAFITHAFLSLLYPSFEASRRHFFPRTATISSTLTDRQILNSLAERILDPASLAQNASPDLVRALAETAFRARRVDLLGRIAVCGRRADDASLRLWTTTRALELLTMDAQRRRDADLVVPSAAAFCDSVKASAREGADNWTSADLELLRQGLTCLTRPAGGGGFAINRPLEPFIAEVCLALLRNRDLAAGTASRVPDVVERVLRYLVRSRNPRLAEAVFDAIPRRLVSLKHYRVLLASDHAPLAHRAWTSLLAHPTLRPDAATVRAALIPVAQSRERTAPTRAFRLFRRLEHPTTRDWNLLLAAVARHGSDRLVTRVRREMAAAGAVADRQTAAVLVAREMTRTDAQQRVEFDRLHDTDSLRAQRRVVEQPRRVSGAAQIRRVRLAAREWEQHIPSGLGTSSSSSSSSSLVLGERGREEIVPNLLLKNAARWPKEYSVDKLVRLAKAQLGVDLAGAATPGPDHVAAAAPKPAANPSIPTQRHFEQVRRPAFRTLAKALEQRRRADLASTLRRHMREEEARVRSLERRARRGLEKQS